MIIFCLYLKNSTYKISQFIKRIFVVCVRRGLLKAKTVLLALLSQPQEQLLAYSIFIYVFIGSNTTFDHNEEV